MANPLLNVENLTVKIILDTSVLTVVEDLSFQLFQGKTLGIVGESGSGKTMTALSLMKIFPNYPTFQLNGKIIYNNQNLVDLKEKEMRKIRGSRIGMIFQNPSTALNPVYTIGNQLMEVAELHLNLFGEQAEAKAIQALQEVGISAAKERLNDYPHQLSGGMKQRVMIAMALMCEPDILIADEPTTALDVTIQAQVLQLMKDLQKKKNMAILLITHDIGVIAEMADDVIVMYAAKDMEKGKVADIFNNTAHPYTKGLFDSKPKIGQETIVPIKGNIPSPSHFPDGCHFHPRCPFCMEKCKRGEIANFFLSDDHYARCVLYDQSVESCEKLQQRTIKTIPH